jgi:hypothetical protein
MVSDGVKAAQINAKHSLNGCWMADSFQTAAVLSALKQAVAWLNPRQASTGQASTGQASTGQASTGQASTGQASTGRAAGRHAAPAGNRAPRDSPALPPHDAGRLASPLRLDGRPAS